MNEDLREEARNGDAEEPPSRPAPRNPFEEPDPSDEERGPALIDTRRSAAIMGVVVGLVALFFVVAICVATSIAFG
ncbi:hypothetical protein BH23CHL2_BH23CHL2_03360 [soil metagenome]